MPARGVLGLRCPWFAGRSARLNNGSPHRLDALSIVEVKRHGSSTSLRELWAILVRRGALVASIEGGLLLVCLLYCLIAPNQYEASARVELRTSPASALNLESPDSFVSASILSAPIALETVADVFRSDQLAWRVIRRTEALRGAGIRGAILRAVFRVSSGGAGGKRGRSGGAGVAAGAV